MTDKFRAAQEIRSVPNYLLAHLSVARDFSDAAVLITPEATADWVPKTQLEVAWALLDKKFGQQGVAFVKETLLPLCDDQNLTQAQQQAEAGNWEAVIALKAAHAPPPPLRAASSPYASSRFGYR